MHERFRYKNKEELITKVKELGYDLPYSDDLSPLFDHLVLDGIKIPNRLVVQPMEGYDSEENGSPSSLTERRYLRYASGGSGVIWFEAVAVSSEGRSNPHQLLITEGNKGSFTSLTDKIKKEADVKANGLVGEAQKQKDAIIAKARAEADKLKQDALNKVK